MQVSDSRCYTYHDGVLRQVTRDQTIAQEMVDRGALSPERAQHSPLNHVHLSAIGAGKALPVISRVDVGTRGTVTLVCSDGLIMHVSDEDIGSALSRMTSSEQLCHELVDLVLERGGRDNVTVVVGRAPP